MPEYYSYEDVVQSPFLFISYNHVDKTITQELARYLLDQGVRLWYDEDLKYGERWREKVEDLLRHDNCVGVVFVCSSAAIISENVAEERKIAIQEQRKRGEDAYFFFPVNVSHPNCSISYMQMLKQAFESQNFETIDKLFPLKRLNDYMQIIGLDTICAMTGDPDCKQQLLNAIEKHAKVAVNPGTVALEEMEKASRINGLCVSLGEYTVDGISTPLVWQLLYNDEKKGVFLLRPVLDKRLGNDLVDWLNKDFLKTAFTEEQQQVLAEPIRLLTCAEVETIPAPFLQCRDPWWLSDIPRGVLQMVVLEDGTIYRRGCANMRVPKGVRPVITLELEQATKLMKQ